MRKGKLIEKYIGEGLIPLGFLYKGRQGDCWEFERRVEKVRQTIILREYRFERNMITFDFFTNVKGNSMVQAANVEGIQWNSYFPGYWKYEDENRFIEVLIQLKDIFVKKGIGILEQMSIPDEDEIDDTNDMHHMLYFHHKELGEKYQKEHHIQVTGFDQGNIDRWFAFIEERVAELKKGEYEEAKEELVEMAAFLGDVLIQYKGGNWDRFTDEDYECCSIEGVKAKNDSGINMLRLLVGGYAKNGIQWVKNAYQRLLD